MSSSDYMDALEIGLPPEEDSQYWVAPHLQKVIDNFIKTHKPDVAELLSKITYMHLA